MSYKHLSTIYWSSDHFLTFYIVFFLVFFPSSWWIECLTRAWTSERSRLRFQPRSHQRWTASRRSSVPAPLTAWNRERWGDARGTGRMWGQQGENPPPDLLGSNLCFSVCAGGAGQPDAQLRFSAFLQDQTLCGQNSRKDQVRVPTDDKTNRSKTKKKTNIPVYKLHWTPSPIFFMEVYFTKSETKNGLFILKVLRKTLE